MQKYFYFLYFLPQKINKKTGKILKKILENTLNRTMDVTRIGV